MVCWEIFSKTKLFVVKDLSLLRRFNKSAVISFSKILSILENREIGLYVDASSLESFLWMGITLAAFKLIGNIPVEKDKLLIVARCLDIWSWTRRKILVGILLGPQDLLMLRDDITFQIYSWFVAVIMKESLFFCW